MRGEGDMRMSREGADPNEFRPATFDEEEAADLQRHYWRNAVRLSLAFLVLFAFVYGAFWWSGSAVRFGAARVGDRGVPTWHVVGTVRSAASHEPIPWAKVEDDDTGRPPFFQAEADRAGVFELTTFAEPHRIRISAPGYRPSVVQIGRIWFLWMPQGKEKRDTELIPD